MITLLNNRHPSYYKSFSHPIQHWKFLTATSLQIDLSLILSLGLVIHLPTCLSPLPCLLFLNCHPELHVQHRNFVFFLVPKKPVWIKLPHCLSGSDSQRRQDGGKKAGEEEKKRKYEGVHYWCGCSFIRKHNSITGHMKLFASPNSQGVEGSKMYLQDAFHVLSFHWSGSFQCSINFPALVVLNSNIPHQIHI